MHFSHLTATGGRTEEGGLTSYYIAVAGRVQAATQQQQQDHQQHSMKHMDDAQHEAHG